MITSRLLATLKRDEGCNLQRHDVAGIDHIGYGRNLIHKGLTESELAHLGVDDEDDIETITQVQAEYLLENDIKEAATNAASVIGGDRWERLSDVRQEVCTNICFNVGKAGFSKFRRAIAAIHSESWEEAAAQLLDSRAAQQSGQRYHRLAKAMEFNDSQYFEVETAAEKETEPLDTDKTSNAGDHPMKPDGRQDTTNAELLATLRDLQTKIDILIQALPDTAIPATRNTVTPKTDDPINIPDGEAPAWLQLAKKHIGLDEHDDRDTIMQDILQPAGIDIDPSETPWCAAFVRAVLTRCGLPVPNTLRARDFEEYGQACQERLGAIIVYRSHVGFVSEPGKILGGNQSDGINIGNQEWYGKPIAYRFPDGYQV